MVVDGATVTCRVRVFHDDAQAVLRRFANRPTLRIVDGASQDSLFERYVEAKVSVTSDGTPLRPRVIDSGRDTDATTATMWWYVIEYRAPRSVTSLAIRHQLMFEQFENQRNVMTILKMPREERYSLYFAAGDSREQVVRF